MNSEKEASRQALEELKKKRLDEFMAGFDVITMKLKEMYQVGGPCTGSSILDGSVG